MNVAALESLDLLPPAVAPAGSLLIAYSGGLDSMVLLHLLASRTGANLRALHVHHGLQPQADAWAEHCREFCVDLGVPLRVLRVTIDPRDAAGPEAAARRARYAALRGEMAHGDCLVLAHHRDDQAETVLLRLLRGSGVQGLGAMRRLCEFAPGRLWRPLLDIPRAELKAYAKANALRWIEDPHNADARYARSWLRQEIIPRLEARFAQTHESLTRTATLAAESAELLDELARSDLSSLHAGSGLDVPALLATTAPRRRNVLRFWLQTQGFETPSAAQLERVSAEVLMADKAARPCLRWRGCELRRYRDRLYAMRPLPLPPAQEALRWATGNRLALPDGCGELETETGRATGTGSALIVRFAQGGEQLKPAGAAHARSLKNLFQEAAVPPWVRRRTPLIELDGAIACVSGVAASAAWKEFVDNSGRRLRWRHPLAGAESPLEL